MLFSRLWCLSLICHECFCGEDTTIFLLITSGACLVMSLLLKDLNPLTQSIKRCNVLLLFKQFSYDFCMVNNQMGKKKIRNLLLRRNPIHIYVPEYENE